ncbi:MAG: polysaccharide deacetylase family protein [Bacteroidetes bacterium]|nr:polysaccharide deacetylase family protein [Bacteroidota bacterium]
MLNQGYFLISLDFELQWGRFDKVALNQERKQELENTLILIPKLLMLFEKYEVAATWAIVGMLFNKDRDEWIDNLPTCLPNYEKAKFSSYEYFKNVSEPKNFDNCFFALNTIKTIANAPLQEIASHTYSHYYCLEKWQTDKEFLDDLLSAKKIAKKNKLNFDSLVFPRNQFNNEYYKKCSLLGLQAIRTNPENWYWNTKKKDTIFKRLFRLIDTFNFLSYDKCVTLNYFLNQKSKPFLLPSSRFLRAWMPNNSLGNFLKIKRVCFEMNYAAKHKKYYHIWWHPENFGKHPDKCLIETEAILKHYKKLNEKYQFKSITMSNFSNLIQKNK